MFVNVFMLLSEAGDSLNYRGLDYVMNLYSKEQKEWMLRSCCLAGEVELVKYLLEMGVSTIQIDYRELDFCSPFRYSEIFKMLAEYSNKNGQGTDTPFCNQEIY